MGIFSSKFKTFCAFCRSPRSVYRKKSVSFLNIVSAFLAAIVFMFILWQGYDPRVMIVWVINIVIAEAFIRFRWRLSVPCPHCGFDPVIYKKEPEKAAAMVKAQLQRRKEDPRYLLTRPLNLPALSAERAKMIEGAKKPGSYVSRSL